MQKTRLNEVAMRESRVFISSVYHGLHEIRQRMKEAAESVGVRAWIFEEVDDLRGVPPQKSQRICLDNVDASDLYVAIFHQGYGSSAANHLGGISLVDLEFFEAFKNQKPIRVYMLEPFNPEPNLAALIQIVRSLVPDSISICSNEKSLLAQFTRDIQSCLLAASKNHLGKGETIFGRFLQRLCAFRKPFDHGVGLRFLSDKYPPPCRERFSRDIVEEQLANLSSLSNWHERLRRTMKVIEHLFDVPWKDGHNAEFLPLWDQAFGSWDKSSAWVGLHGPLLMGKLAADNSLLAVRSLRASHGEEVTLQSLLSGPPSKTGTIDEWASLYSLGGAIASEYYSIAKMSSGRSTRHYYFKRSEEWLRCARRGLTIRPDRIHEAGLAAIWGHVSLGLCNVVEAVGHFQKSLRLRTENNASAASVAEAEADLGFAYILSGNKTEGEALLLKGVEGLERTMSKGFTARAKRMIATHYVRQGHFREALTQLAQVSALCKKYGMPDKSSEVFGLRMLHIGARYIYKDIPQYNVIETAQGYQYVES